MSCPHAVALTLLVLLFFVGGAIAGAYAAELIVASIVPIAIFGIVLLIATAIALYPPAAAAEDSKIYGKLKRRAVTLTVLIKSPL